MMDRSYLFVPGNRPERRVDLDLTRHINGFTLMLGLKLTPQMSFAAVSARRWTKGEGPNSDLMQTVLYESRCPLRAI